MKKLQLFLLIISLVTIGCHQPPEEQVDRRLIIFPNPVGDSGTANIIVYNEGVSFSLKAFDNKGNEIDVSPQSSSPSYSEYLIQTPHYGTYYVILNINNEEVKQSVIRL